MYILLCGRPPFGSSKPSISRLKAKTLSFPPSIWSHVRRDAIDLIMMMLDERPEVRPSALQCLAHPWIRHFSKMRSISKPERPSSADLRATGTSIRKGVLLFMIIRTTSDSELSRHSAAFNSLDKDGDGLITPQEFMSGLLDSSPKDRASSEVSRIACSGSATRISFSEYLLAVFDVESLISHDKMRTAFDTLEKNNGGNVSLIDLKLSLRVNPSAETQWKALIADLDSEDHSISFSDFEAVIIKALKY